MGGGAAGEPGFADQPLRPIAAGAGPRKRKAGKLQYRQTPGERRRRIREQTCLGKSDAQREIGGHRIWIGGARVGVQAGGQIDGKDLRIGGGADAVDHPRGLQSMPPQSAFRADAKHAIDHRTGRGSPDRQKSSFRSALARKWNS